MKEELHFTSTAARRKDYFCISQKKESSTSCERTSFASHLDETNKEKKNHPLAMIMWTLHEKKESLCWLLYNLITLI